jgi:predicted nucleic acid-binding protein
VNPSGASSPGDYLVDTNVLLRSVEVGHPMRAVARQALQRLTTAGARLFVAPQNLIEFWVVATRPLSAKGLGLTPAQAAVEVVNFKTAFQMLPDTSAIFTHWERIAATYSVQGKRAHDARLVAVMKVHGIGQILTFNISDFRPYASGECIVVVDPAGRNQRGRSSKRQKTAVNGTLQINEPNDYHPNPVLESRLPSVCGKPP